MIYKEGTQMSITENYQKIRAAVPESVAIVAAAKQRTAEEVTEIIDAGAKYIGENYVQEAENIYIALGEKSKNVQWHMIGHLQSNKINKALKVFDLIQSVDSLKKAEGIDKRVENADRKQIPVLIEINIGSEISKSGIPPEYEIIESLVKGISTL